MFKVEKNNAKIGMYLANIIEQKFLPIGTVVLLKGADKKIMITGFGILDDVEHKIYEYMGCLYPEGFISVENNLVFDHEQIAEICALGFSNEEDKEFRKKFREHYENLVKKQIENLKKSNETNVEEILEE